MIKRVCQSPRWSCVAPFSLGLSTFNVYGSASTNLPADGVAVAVDDVTLTRTRGVEEAALAGTIGTEDVAIAALLPQPVALIVMRLLLTNALAMVFLIANALLLPTLATWLLFTSGPQDAAPLNSLFFFFVLPVIAFEALLYAVTMLLAYVPILQAHSGLLHGIKYLAFANSAGPFDTGYAGFGRRDCGQPHLAGLPHARNLQIRTGDGEKIGAWHVLPSG